MAEISMAREGLDAPSRRTRPHASIAAALAAESERRVLWLPVWFGGGIALYFALTVEPPIWLGPAMMLPAIAAAILLRRRPIWRGMAVSVAFAAAGFALITETTRERAAPMLDRRLGPAAITGSVVDIDTLDRGWRIIVAPDAVPGLDPARQPRFLRIHITAASDLLSPGDRVSLKAMLYPCPGRLCLARTTSNASFISPGSGRSVTPTAERAGSRASATPASPAVGGNGSSSCAPT